MFLLPFLHLNGGILSDLFKKIQVNKRTQVCTKCDKCDLENMISSFNGFPLLEACY